MTRRAIEAGFDRYLSTLVDETYAAFDVAAVLRGSRGGGSRVVSKLLKNSGPLDRHVVRPKLREYQRTIARQFEPVLDYAAAGDADFEQYADAVLARDIYWEAVRDDIRGKRRERIRERLLSRQRAFGDDIAPVLATESDDFARAVADAYDREAAMALIDEHFRFSAPLREERGAFALELDIDPGDVLGGLARALPSLTVDFTDEAVRAMGQAEQKVIPTAKADVAAAYEH